MNQVTLPNPMVLLNEVGRLKKILSSLSVGHSDEARAHFAGWAWAVMQGQTVGEALAKQGHTTLAKVQLPEIELALRGMQQHMGITDPGMLESGEFLQPLEAIAPDLFSQLK